MNSVCYPFSGTIPATSVQTDRDYLITDICITVCRYFNISLQDMRLKSRLDRIVYPRQIAIWFVFKTEEFKSGEIAEYFNQHHSSIFYSLKHITELARYDPKTQKRINELYKIIFPA